MPYPKIKSGKNRGKYKSPSGRILTYSQIQAIHLNKKKKRKKGKK